MQLCTVMTVISNNRSNINTYLVIEEDTFLWTVEGKSVGRNGEWNNSNTGLLKKIHSYGLSRGSL